MLLVDSADGRAEGPFHASARRLAGRLLPERPLAPLPETHTLFKSFYLVKRAVGRVAVTPRWEGASRDGRLLILYSENDLGGAWQRDSLGQWTHSVYPEGERQREVAFRWGVNIVMYALCLDYKSDQVHIPFILRRRRWQVGP